MKKIIYLVMCCMMFIITGCSSVNNKPIENQTEMQNTGEKMKITADEAKEMMDTKDVIIVDVRTKKEYDSGHIKNAINIPNENINNVMLDELPDKNATILVYCRSGARSHDASDKLVKIGYNNIYDFGGIIDWKYEIE